jgi:hypothetical protein
VIVLSGLSVLNWNSPHRRFFVMDSFHSICDRLLRIFSYIRPLGIPERLLRWPECCSCPRHPVISQLHNFIFDSEMNPSFLKECVHHIQIMILGHAPLEAFRPATEMGNGRVLLTYALHRLLYKVNFRRDLTHPQLLFVFSTIFNYVSAFARDNQIDSQLLATYIQGLPTVSPFCRFAFSRSGRGSSPGRPSSTF